MWLPDFPYCVCIKNSHYAEVYFVLVLLVEVVEIRSENNVAHNFVRHRHSVLHVFDTLNNDMVVQPLITRLLHGIHDFLHQRSPLVMQSDGIDFTTLQI